MRRGDDLADRGSHHEDPVKQRGAPAVGGELPVGTGVADRDSVEHDVQLRVGERDEPEAAVRAADRVPVDPHRADVGHDERWHRHALEQALLHRHVVEAVRSGPAIGPECRHLKVTKAQLMSGVDLSARREVVEQRRPNPVRGPALPPAPPLVGPGRAGGTEGAPRDLDAFHHPGREDPGAEAIRPAGIRVQEGAILHGEIGAVVPGDADRDVQPARESSEELMVGAAQAGERTCRGREPDVRQFQLDAADRDRGSLPDGDEPEHELLSGPARSPQDHTLPAGLQRDAVQFRPENERCPERVGAWFQADGDGSLTGVAVEKGLQRGPAVDICRPDVHRAAATLPARRLGQAGKLRYAARRPRAPLVVPGQHGQRAGPEARASRRLGFGQVAFRVDDGRLDRPQREAPEVASMETLAGGERNGDAGVAEQDRLSRRRLGRGLPHPQVELRGLLRGQVVARRRARDHELFEGRIIGFGDRRDEAVRRRDVAGVAELDRVPQQLDGLVLHRVVVAVHRRAGERESGGRCCT